MLSKHEQDFLLYWEASRLRKKKFFKQFSFGLPIGVLMAVILFINLLSGWYDKADMILRSNSSVIVVILIAVLIIIFFVSFFSGNYKWEQNEQRYQELKMKQQKQS